jgi:hypothetical protein
LADRGDSTSDARCPRCGYDQRGLIESWRDACPVQGTCSECGLEFRWAELLNPFHQPPRWCIESHGPWWKLPGQFARTSCCVIWPWALWRSLAMTDHVRWGRLAGYCLAWLIIHLMLFCLCNGLSALQEWHFFGSKPDWSVSTGIGVVFAQAVFLPFSDESLGMQVHTSGNAYPYSPPSYHARLMLYQSWRALVLLPSIYVCCALAFVALPTTRRVSKVRWTHLARVAAYGVPLLLPACGLAMMAAVVEQGGFTYAGRVAVLALVAMLMLLPTMLLWWSVAAGQYLKMRLPWVIAFFMVLVGILAPLAVAALIGYALSG